MISYRNQFPGDQLSVSGGSGADPPPVGHSAFEQSRRGPPPNSAPRCARGPNPACHFCNEFLRQGTSASRRRSVEADEHEPLTAQEIDDSFAYFDTEDFREGYAAYLQKRKPGFKGR